jgi:hypothetical protein
MNEALLDYPVMEDEVEYTAEEIDAIYKDYEERVLKKQIFKMWCKEYLK